MNSEILQILLPSLLPNTDSYCVVYFQEGFWFWEVECEIDGWPNETGMKNTNIRFYRLFLYYLAGVLDVSSVRGSWLLTRLVEVVFPYVSWWAPGTTLFIFIIKNCSGLHSYRDKKNSITQFAHTLYGLPVSRKKLQSSREIKFVFMSKWFLDISHPNLRS